MLCTNKQYFLMNNWRKRSKLEKRLYISTLILLIIIICLIVSICIVSIRKSPVSDCKTCQTNVCKTSGEELKRWIDYSVDPCDDFYGHCCGGWLRENPLPSNTEMYSISNKLELEIAEDIKKILDETTNDANTPYSVNKMLRFYKACLDTDNIEKNGAKPLLEFLKDIGGWPLLSNDWNNKNYDWVEVISKLIRKTATGYLIRFIVSPDVKNTSNYIIQLDRPSLLLDTKELLNSNNETSNLKEYKALIKNVSKFLNSSSDRLDEEIEGIIEFERNLAQISAPLTEPEENWYNKATIEEFQEKLPKFELLRYLQLVTNETLEGRVGKPLTNKELIIIRNVQYIQNLTEFIEKQPGVQRQIANYLGWRVIAKHNAHFPANFVKILRPNSKSTSERWKFCVSLTNVAMGYAVAHVYIASKRESFQKADVIEMVGKLKTIFINTVQNAEWMDTNTTEEALRKIEAMEYNIGYPNWLKSKTSLDEFYETMGEMGRDPFSNDLTVTEYTSTQLLLSLRQKHKFPEWTVDPLTVNAGYNHNENSITVPVAMFQSPFYDYGLPRYLNFARIGAVIGHEITHGFDTKGSERDADGNTINWWTKDSRENFDKRANCFVEQYNNSYRVNGERTLAENIADNGGLKQAYLGYKNWERLEVSSMKILPGFEQYTSDQLFFLSYCTMWCTHYSELAWNVSLSLQHSPSLYRVWGTVSNMKEFSEAFQCSPSKKMNPEKKCNIW